MIRVIYKDTEYWKAHENDVLEQGTLCIYADYKMVDDKWVPGMKVADGVNKIADLVFVTDDMVRILLAHISNTGIHTTAAEKKKWNHKIDCYDKIFQERFIIYRED